MLLPLLAASLVVLWLIDLVLLRISPGAAAWLGIPPPGGSTATPSSNAA
ncbi:MAG TPA: hypothetical protein VMK82_10435 [Steroidobacteraceae bacterium]|nr:hypothetical protein [Steroidobacteraceae bacterium]